MFYILHIFLIFVTVFTFTYKGTSKTSRCTWKTIHKIVEKGNWSTVRGKLQTFQQQQQYI